MGELTWIFEPYRQARSQGRSIRQTKRRTEPLLTRCLLELATILRIVAARCRWTRVTTE